MSLSCPTSDVRPGASVWQWGQSYTMFVRRSFLWSDGPSVGGESDGEGHCRTADSGRLEVLLIFRTALLCGWQCNMCLIIIVFVSVISFVVSIVAMWSNKKYLLWKNAPQYWSLLWNVFHSTQILCFVIKTIEGGKKDALLRRANIKKKCISIHPYTTQTTFFHISVLQKAKKWTFTFLPFATLSAKN